jgi:anaerobic selenocysteine-containing dehydrogenase
VVLSVDSETRRITDIRGDKDHPLTQGYACMKGLQAEHIQYGPQRLLYPLKRMPDGSFERIGIEQALDEIAVRLEAIIADGGARSLALYRGTQNYLNTVTSALLQNWLASFGSPGFYSSATIDAFSKFVAAGRMGTWEAGLQPIETSDVWMCVGFNPLVSIQSLMGFPTLNPTKRMQEFRARGMKLIVVDPRKTETAHYADIHLQLYPGEDPTLASGLLHIILREGWHDKQFCAQHVDGLDTLREHVAAFTPAYVARRAGVEESQLIAAAQLFAQGPRGFVSYCTAPCMVHHSVLATGLWDAINMVCGRYRREGEPIGNPGVMTRRIRQRAQTSGPQHYWKNGPRSRVGEYHGFFGEMMTNTLAHEIVTPGEGRVRSLFVFGGNPLAAMPDQAFAANALGQLDLLVTVDPVMTNTAKLSHYIFPPKILYEREDMTGFLETQTYPVPFAQYTPAIVAPPEGAEVIDEWYLLWSIASRLGVPLSMNGIDLDMATPPTTQQLIEIVARSAQVSFEEIQSATAGRIFDVPAQGVEPAGGGGEPAGRFQLADPDMMAELAEVAAEMVEHGAYEEEGSVYTHRLAIRRMREVMNSMLIESDNSRRRFAANPAQLNPEDMTQMGLSEGDKVTITGSQGNIMAIVSADATLKRGVVTVSHCWGGLPGDGSTYEQMGASTNRLTSASKFIEPVNAMARMTGIPVNITRFDDNIMQ